METISYTAARANLAKKMHQVCENHAPIIITRAGEKPVVMLALEDYEAMEETNYLLRSPANAAKLAGAVAEIETMLAEKSKKKSK